MTEVSPSSKKVDEFLLSLSQLSQDRLRDNQKRQRDLQRDIDELRASSASPYSPHRTAPDASHGITELKFNRSARDSFREKWRDVAPDLPQRPLDSDPESPPLPRRPKPDRPPKPEKLPGLPARPLEPTLVDVSVDVVRPVARKSETPLVSRAQIQVPQYSTSGASRAGGASRPGAMLSFGQLESKIHAGSQVFTLQPEKPVVPSKPRVLKDDLETRPEKPKPEQAKPKEAVPRPNIFAEKPLKPVKPPKPEKPPQVEEVSLRTSVGGAPLAKPQKPPKPSFRTFEASDTQELKQQIQRLSPTKSSTSFLAKVTQPKDVKPPAPLKPVKPRSVGPLEVPEALNALAKLRAAKPRPVPTKVESKPDSQPLTKPVKPAAISEKNDAKPQPDFHAKLSNILRASTEPSLAAPAAVPTGPIRRSQTLNENTKSTSTSAKLTHPNKSRAKGPKRKLPKQLHSDSTSSVNATPSTTGSATPVSYTTSLNEASTSTNEESEVVFSRPLKKAPPPIKAKKPAFEPRPKRVISGELFL